MKSENEIMANANEKICQIITLLYELDENPEIMAREHTGVARWEMAKLANHIGKNKDNALWYPDVKACIESKKPNIEKFLKDIGEHGIQFLVINKNGKGRVEIIAKRENVRKTVRKYAKLHKINMERVVDKYNEVWFWIHF